MGSMVFPSDRPGGQEVWGSSAAIGSVREVGTSRPQPAPSGPLHSGLDGVPCTPLLNGRVLAIAGMLRKREEEVVRRS